MSLIKEALDKVEQEKEEQEAAEGGEAVVRETEKNGGENQAQSRSFTMSTLIWSVIIVILATFVGGMLSALLMFMLR